MNSTLLGFANDYFFPSHNRLSIRNHPSHIPLAEVRDVQRVISDPLKYNVVQDQLADPDKYWSAFPAHAHAVLANVSRLENTIGVVYELLDNAHVEDRDNVSPRILSLFSHLKGLAHSVYFDLTELTMREGFNLREIDQSLDRPLKYDPENYLNVRPISPEPSEDGNERPWGENWSHTGWTQPNSPAVSNKENLPPPEPKVEPKSPSTSPTSTKKPYGYVNWKGKGKYQKAKKTLPFVKNWAKNQQRRTKACWKCGQPGHFWRQCPLFRCAGCDNLYKHDYGHCPNGPIAPETWHLFGSNTPQPSQGSSPMPALKSLPGSPPPPITYQDLRDHDELTPLEIDFLERVEATVDGEIVTMVDRSLLLA
jgi:hypothetical protein